MATLPVELCLPGPEIGDVRVRPGGRFVSAVVSGAPDGTVPARLTMWDITTGEPNVISGGPEPAAGRGLSGGVHHWHPDGGSVAYVASDGSVWRCDVTTHRATEILPAAGRRWWGPVHSHEGRSLAAVADWNELVRVDADGTVSSVHREDDGWVVDPAWFGDSPVAHRWSRPEMSWTTSSLTGSPVRPGESVQQPFSAGTCTGWVSDENGAWNVVVDGITVDDGLEHAGPVWGPGQRTWCTDDGGRIVAYARNEAGFGSLWVHDRASGARMMVGRAVHGCVSWSGPTLAAVRTGARTPPQLVAYDMSDALSPRRVLTAGTAPESWSVFDTELVEPTVHAAGDVPYRLYRAARPNGRLVVWVHGGPVDQWQVTWRPRFTYWLSRGYSIAVPDHRGSTGHGRAFRLALEGGWGAVDADDTALVARHAQGLLGTDASRTALMGGSAGGLSVLSAAARHTSLAACAVVSYPVTDLRLLLATPDPFEGHYNSRLVGDPAVSPAVSPGHLVDVPVLSFHGDRDELVVPAHSLWLRDAMTAAGGSVRVEMMAGEGHGFRDPANIVREYALTEAFLGEHLA